MTQPQKTQESSVLFSLNELMIMEEDRLRAEEGERTRQAAAARAAEHEKQAMRAAQERAALEADEQRREAERRAEAEEQARLDGIKAAIIAQQRAEEARRARDLANAQEHERAMARITQDNAARKLRRALATVVIGATAVVASGLGVYFGKIKPDTERRAAIATEELAAERAAANAAQKETEAAQVRLVQLQKELVDANTPSKRAEVETKIEKEQGVIRHNQQVSPRKLPVKVDGVSTNCGPGSRDPLCGFAQ
jgi:colicin import membrane protein